MFHFNYSPEEVAQRVVFEGETAHLVVKGHGFPINKLSFTNGLCNKITEVVPSHAAFTLKRTFKDIYKDGEPASRCDVSCEHQKRGFSKVIFFKKDLLPDMPLVFSIELNCDQCLILNEMTQANPVLNLPPVQNARQAVVFRPPRQNAARQAAAPYRKRQVAERQAPALQAEANRPLQQVAPPIIPAPVNHPIIPIDLNEVTNYFQNASRLMGNQMVRAFGVCLISNNQMQAIDDYTAKFHQFNEAWMKDKRDVEAAAAAQQAQRTE